MLREFEQHANLQAEFHAKLKTRKTASQVGQVDQVGRVGRLESSRHAPRAVRAKSVGREQAVRSSGMAESRRRNSCYSFRPTIN
jgi:hypothetical protein